MYFSVLFEHSTNVRINELETFNVTAIQVKRMQLLVPFWSWVKVIIYQTQLKEAVKWRIDAICTAEQSAACLIKSNIVHIFPYLKG